MTSISAVTLPEIVDMKTALNAKLLLPGVKTTSNRDAVKPEFSWHTSNASDSSSNMADVEEDNAKRESNNRAIVLRLKNMIEVGAAQRRAGAGV